IKGAKQAVQMFGPAQHGVAKAVQDSVAEGVIPADEADDLYILVGVFIHWEASDDAKIQKYNYDATKEAIARAVKGFPTAAEATGGVDIRGRRVPADCREPLKVRPGGGSHPRQGHDDDFRRPKRRIVAQRGRPDELLAAEVERQYGIRGQGPDESCVGLALRA